jgi:hypothetical protein
MKDKMGEQISWGTVGGAILLVLYMSYHYGYSRGSSAPITPSNALPAEGADIDSLKAENAQLKEQWLATQQQYQITLEAKKNLEAYLMLVEKNNAAMTRDLAIVHTVKGPLEPKAEFKIAHFQIFPTQQTRTFRYMLLLTRQGPGSARSERGSVSMVIQGRMGKKLIFLPVKYEESVHIDGLGFQCQDVQELLGELTLPAQFEPMEVLFKIRTDEGGEQSQQVFPWQTA